MKLNIGYKSHHWSRVSASNWSLEFVARRWLSNWSSKLSYEWLPSPKLSSELSSNLLPDLEIGRYSWLPEPILSIGKWSSESVPWQRYLSTGPNEWSIENIWMKHWKDLNKEKLEWVGSSMLHQLNSINIFLFLIKLKSSFNL